MFGEPHCMPLRSITWFELIDGLVVQVGVVALTAIPAVTFSTEWPFLCFAVCLACIT